MMRVVLAGALLFATFPANTKVHGLSLSNRMIQEADCMLESHPAVNDLLTSWREALASGTPDRIATLVTEEAEFWSPGQPPLHGRAQVVEAFRAIFERYAMDQEFHCREIVVVQGWAFMRGLEVNRLTDRESGEEMTVRQRAFSVMRRGPEGRWRFHRGMTNEPPEAEAGG